MRQVVYALIPGTLAMLWYFGWGVMLNIIIAVTIAVLAEALMLSLRKKPVTFYLSDYSAVVTGWLLALALPPLAPWWLTAVGAMFAIIVVKHLYGGIGYNPFNPAMAGYVMVLISFPEQMTHWPPPYMLADSHLNVWQSIVATFSGSLPAGSGWDAVTMATPLDSMRTQLGLNFTIEEIRSSPLWGDFGGRGWEWIANWYMLGGLWLLYKRIISWHIPVAMLASLLAISTVFYVGDPDIHPLPLFHLFSGGAMLGAFFIATDPVSSSTTPKGRLIYASGIGVLTFVIRSWGGYPDGVAFAVLIMNMAVPLIDNYTRPRVFGHGI